MKAKKGRARDHIGDWRLDEDDTPSSTPGSASFMVLANPAVLKPRNPAQERYLRLLEDDSPCIVVATGAAGTGKTMFAVHAAARKLQSGRISKIVLTRPAVCADEEIGFLPGTMEAKMMPHLLPIYDQLQRHFSKQDIDKMIAKGTIEVSPFGYMRGRTFEDAFVIADETQNCTRAQVLMLLTRLGRGSKLVLTGDPSQHDRGREANGLQDFVDRYERAAGADAAVGGDIQVVRFTESDVERHPVIRTLLRMYGEGVTP